MFGKKFPPQPEGRPIACRTLNPPIAEVERLGRFSATAPLAAHYSSSGIQVRLDSPDEVDARITAVGSGGVYGWRGIFADASSPGTWLDLDSTISGTTAFDPAIERNGNATLTVGTRVAMKRIMGAWYFSYDRCS